jgi:transposase
MAEQAATPCPGCQRLQEQLDAQRGQIEALQATVARLQEQLASARKDSSTSSKPPSSDIVKPGKTSGTEPTRRPRGGQPGHPKHERALFPFEMVNQSFDHRPDPCCPDCGHKVRPTGLGPRVIQQVDVPEVPLYIEEHRVHEAYCPHCDKVYYGRLPLPVERGGLLGPRLTTLVAYLKGACHASYSTVRKFLRDVVGLTISRGQLSKVIAKVSDAMEQAWRDLLEELPGQPVLNVDETGHKDQGERMWTWCFRASLFTLFKIDPTRSADVLIKVLGEEFQGVLGCDFYSAYRRFMRTLSRGVAAAIQSDPPGRATATGRVPQAVASSACRGDSSGYPGRAGDESGGEPGGTDGEVRGQLLPLHHHPGSPADEQHGGAGDPLRGDRQAHNPGDAGGQGAALV